jgi:hypothetical protein
MQPLLPVFVTLIFIALLLPPVLLISTVLRQQRRIGWTTRSSMLAAATIGGSIAVAFNTLFVILRMGDIMVANLKPDAFLILAIMVSWFSFFGRIALKSTLRHKRKLKEIGVS